MSRQATKGLLRMHGLHLCKVLNKTGNGLSRQAWVMHHSLRCAAEATYQTNVWILCVFRETSTRPKCA